MSCRECCTQPAGERLFPSHCGGTGASVEDFQLTSSIGVSEDKLKQLPLLSEPRSENSLTQQSSVTPTIKPATTDSGTQTLCLCLLTSHCTFNIQWDKHDAEAAYDGRGWGFPSQKTNFQPPKAFSRHLILYPEVQSKCQVFGEEI